MSGGDVVASGKGYDTQMHLGYRVKIDGNYYDSVKSGNFRDEFTLSDFQWSRVGNPACRTSYASEGRRRDATRQRKRLIAYTRCAV